MKVSQEVQERAWQEARKEWELDRLSLKDRIKRWFRSIK